MSMNCTLYAISPSAAGELMDRPEAVEEFFSGAGENVLRLQKAWHGVHFVLTGTAWEGKNPFCFLLSGGEAIEEDADDPAETPLRVLPPAYVKKLDKALSEIGAAEFERRFDLKKLAKEQIYPRIWDEGRESLLAEYHGYYDRLVEFVRATAAAKQAILVQMD